MTKPIKFKRINEVKKCFFIVRKFKNVFWRVTSDRKRSVSVWVSAESSVSICNSVSVSFNLSVSAQTKPRFWYFGFGLNSGFNRSQMATPCTFGGRSRKQINL